MLLHELHWQWAIWLRNMRWSDICDAYAHKSDICGICGWCTSADVSAWPLANLNWKSMQAQISSKFYKVLQISVRPNILNAGGSRISNITFRCVMKAMRVSLHIFISLYFSAFLFISMHVSAFLCISRHFSAFLYISQHFFEFLCISLHFTAFYVLGQLYGAYLRPMGAIFY